MSGPPPTIGYFRELGMARLSVTCANLQCRHSAKLAFDDLKMEDDVTFIDIPQSRRFLCTLCGGRRVEVFPDWTDVGGNRGWSGGPPVGFSG